MNMSLRTLLVILFLPKLGGDVFAVLGGTLARELGKRKKKKKNLAHMQPSQTWQVRSGDIAGTCSPSGLWQDSNQVPLDLCQDPKQDPENPTTAHILDGKLLTAYLYSAIAAVEDVDALLGICLVEDKAAVAGVVLDTPLAAQHQFCSWGCTGGNSCLACCCCNRHGKPECVLDCCSH